MLTIKIRSRPGMTPIVERRFENENDPEARRLSAFYARLGAYSEWARDGAAAPIPIEESDSDTDSDPDADRPVCPFCGCGDASIDGPQVEVHDDLFECCDDDTGGCGRTWWERQRDGQTLPANVCPRCDNLSWLEYDGEGSEGGLINPRYVCESCAYTYWFNGEAIHEFANQQGETP